MKIKLTNEQQSLIQSGTIVVTDKNNVYYFLPYWFKQLGDNTFEVFSFDRLPDDLKETIRNEKKDINPNAMQIEIDREALETLVKGSQPSYSQFDHPLVKKAGHFYSDQYGKTNWSNLKDLTNKELYELYKICKY